MSFRSSYLMNRHYNIAITGKVQGVNYRYSAFKMAQALGIKGFVQNEADGSVYCEAEGEEEMLTRFIQWCHHGPENARVDYVSVNDGELKSFIEFKQNR